MLNKLVQASEDSRMAVKRAIFPPEADQVGGVCEKERHDMASYTDFERQKWGNCNSSTCVAHILGILQSGLCQHSKKYHVSVTMHCGKEFNGE